MKTKERTMADNVREAKRVYFKCVHVSQSGMARWYDAYITIDGCIVRVTYSLAEMGNQKYDKKHEAIRVNGCGFSAPQHIMELAGLGHNFESM